MSADNLWGSLDNFKTIETPVSILRKQGDLLTEATKGILKGHTVIDSQRGGISLSFMIIATQLNNYKYTVLKLMHGITIYPVNFLNSTSPKLPWEKCKDEAELLARIKDILSSQKVRDVIESLLSQSNP